MSGSGLWVAIFGALLLFWGIGAYNRLVRLRAAVSKAFAALDEQLVRQLVWVQGALPESMRSGTSTAPVELQDDATAAWARLQAASDQFGVALAQARRPSCRRKACWVDARALQPSSRPRRSRSAA